MRSWVFLLLIAACGDDGIRHLEDAPLPPDSPPVTVTRPAHDITSGAQKVRGSRFAADVQIGHGISQQPTTSSTRSVEANSAVKP